MTDSDATTTRRSRLRRITFGLGLLITIWVLTITAVFLFVQTETGREWVRNRISVWLSSEPHRTVELGRITVFLPWEMRFDSLVVGDASGVWLRVKGFALRWAPSRLLGGEVHIEDLRADAVQLDRLPESSPESSPREPGIRGMTFKAPPLSIRSLHIPSVSLGHEIFGHAASLELLGFMMPMEEPGGRMAFFEVSRVDEGGEFLVQLQAELVGSGDSLKLRLEMFESADGMLAHALGWDDAGALALRLTGDGPISAWHGTLETRASRRGAITTVLAVALDEELRTEVTGTATLFPAPSSSAGKPQPEREFLFHLQGRYLENRLLRFDHLTAQGEGFSLDAAGHIDFQSEAIDSRLVLTLSHLDVPASGTTAGLKGEGELCARVSGTLQAPRVLASADLRDLTVGGFGGDRLFSQVELEPAYPVGESKSPGWRIVANGKASGLRDSARRPLPEPVLDWLVEVEIPARADTVFVKTLRLTGAQHRLDASGRVETASMTGNLEVGLRVGDLRTLSRLGGKELPGTLDLDFRMTGAGSTRSAAGAVTGRLAVQAEPEADPLASLLGPATTLEARFEIREGTSVHLSDTVIESPAFRLKGDGAFHIAERYLKGEIRASIPELKAFSPVLHEELSGHAESFLKIEGPLDNLTVSHGFKATQARWRQQPPTDIESHLQASHVPGKARGQWKLLATQGSEKLDASLDFERQAERLRLSAVRLDAPGGRLRGDLAVNLEGRTAEGALDGRIEDLGRLGRFIGEPLAGSASLGVRLSAPRGSQNAAVTVSAKNVESRAGKVAGIELSGELKDLRKTLGGNLRAELAGLERGETIVRSAALDVRGDGSRLSFTGKAGGRWMQETEVRLSGSLARDGENLKLELSDLKGRFGSYPFSLKDRLVIRRSPAESALEGFALSLDRGSLAARGVLTSDRVQGRLSLREIPLQLVGLLGGPDWSGSAGGSIDIEGAPSQPGGSLALQLAEVRVSALEAKRLPPASINARARLQGGILRGDVSLEHILEKPARVDYALPLRFSLTPVFTFELPSQAPIEIRAEMEGELGRLAGLLPLPDQTLAGRARTNLVVTGSLADPDFSGDMTLSKGAYENLNSGTVLKGVDAVVTARGKRVEITRFLATDGERGQIGLGGWLELDAANRFPMEIEATLTEAALVRRSDLDATADGTVKIARSAGAMRVEGELTVAPAEYRIPERLPAGVVDLDVTEIDKSGRKISREQPPHPSSEGLPLGLGIALNFPNRTFLRGRGLESEWRGRLSIAGTAAQPSLTGQLNVVRGRFDFLDRRFDLNQGTITFLGTSPPDPYLNLRAQARARDIDALLRVIGPASSPEIQLDSEPPLPQEEILARLLFGRSLDKISPLQALRLAQALRSLAGGSRWPGMDFLGATRRLLGLDQLELRSTDGGSETGLGFGKYLSEDVYVDVEKDLRGAGGRISVEVELTPNISVESEVGADARTGVGINWKYDY